MNPQLFEIFWFRLPFGHSRAMRHCVVIEMAASGTVTLVRISSAMQLYDPYRHFRFDPGDPDFPATGLKKESFCDASKFFEVPASALPKPIGRLQGDLAAKF